MIQKGLSLWSRLTYSYLDRLIYFSQPDSVQDYVPPIGIKDKCENLARRASTILDRQKPKKCHIFWHLLYEYRPSGVPFSSKVSSSQHHRRRRIPPTVTFTAFACMPQ